MSIQECKRDKGSDLHHGSLPTYTRDFPDLFVAHSVTAIFAGPPCRSRNLEVDGSVPDIHEQRLETPRKQAVVRLRVRRAYRCPDCGYRSFQRDCSRCGEGCEAVSRPPS